MSGKSDKERIWRYSLIQGALLAAAAAVLWWIRRRNSMRPQVQQQPVVWRRDIEMGPAEDSPRPAPPFDELVEEEVVIEAIPQVRAGDGGLSEEGTPDLGGEETEETAPEPAGQEFSEEAAQDGDDLKIIEGIGPKINSILQEAGIRTFKQLAQTSVEKLEEILRAAGIRRITNPATWPEQARLAAEGNWSGLENFQKELKAGRQLF